MSNIVDIARTNGLGALAIARAPPSLDVIKVIYLRTLRLTFNFATL